MCVVAHYNILTLTFAITSSKQGELGKEIKTWTRISNERIFKTTS